MSRRNSRSRKVKKKRRLACQHGLITAGIGGVWCWRSTLDNGDTLTLPMLDEFQWPNRSVLICPDSDAWHDGKKAGTFSPGSSRSPKTYNSAGRRSSLCVLPDLHGAKAGLDDWLMIPGHDVEHAGRNSNGSPWMTLDSNRSRPGGRNGKKNKPPMRRSRIRTPRNWTCRKPPACSWFNSKAHSVRMTFDRLSEARGGVYAELSIVLGTTEIRSGVDLGLKSDSGQSKLASGLTRLASAIPWKWLLQKACSLVLKRHREGEPLRILTVDTLIEPLTFQVNPLVFRNKPTVLFGDGGLGKSHWRCCAPCW